MKISRVKLVKMESQITDMLNRDKWNIIRGYCRIGCLRIFSINYYIIIYLIYCITVYRIVCVCAYIGIYVTNCDKLYKSIHYS